jgi:hypothetical protein
MCVVGEIEERWDEQWLVETDKAWDAIHRCLGNGKLQSKGANSLECVVLGGRQLHKSSDYIVSFLTADQVRDSYSAISPLTEEWFREKYEALGRKRFGIFSSSDYAGPISEDDFQCTWSYFNDVRQFFSRAASANRSTIFTVDQ